MVSRSYHGLRSGSLRFACAPPVATSLGPIRGQERYIESEIAINLRPFVPNRPQPGLPVVAIRYTVSMLSQTTRNFADPFGSFTATIQDTPAGPALARLAFGRDQACEPIPEAHAELAERIWQTLDTYFAGGGLEAAGIALSMNAPPFTSKVWARMRAIPFGQTATYGSIATELGSPGASRAVGNACRTNPIPIFVPCHRVLDSAGKLHGYAGGLELKAALLDCENITARV